MTIDSSALIAGLDDETLIDQDLATNTSKVVAVLKSSGLSIVNGNRDRNRYKDGVRVLSPTARFAPVPVTITSRRREIDPADTIAKLPATLAEFGLELHHARVSEDNKQGAFLVTKILNKCKSRDGKNMTRLSGRYWYVQLSLALVWVIETETVEFDPRVLKLKDSKSTQHYRIVATMEKKGNGKKGGHQWMLMDFSTLTEVGHPNMKAGKEAIQELLKGK